MYWKKNHPYLAVNLVFELFTRFVILKSIVRPQSIGQYTERLAFFLDYLETGNEILQSYDSSSTAKLHRFYYEYLTRGTSSDDLLVKSIAKANKHKGFEKILALRFISPVKHLIRSSHSLIEILRNNLLFENEWDLQSGLNDLEHLSYCCTENSDIYAKPRRTYTQLEIDLSFRSEEFARYAALKHEFYTPGYIVERILSTPRTEGLIWALIGAAAQHRKDTIPHLIMEIMGEIVEF
ncbi:hypothetical protein D9M71_538210 [compost metagenome]